MDANARRPLKVRELKAAQAAAAFLAKRSVTPNQISVLSVIFAACASACFILYGRMDHSYSWVLFPAAAFFIQMRLLCNLFDGMVAVEGGKTTNSGELYNDIPDRIADPLILVSAGYAISEMQWALEIAWSAGIFSVLTAYVRTLAASIGAPVNFQGPMAKQHRMALITAASIAAVPEVHFFGSLYSLYISLIIISAGSLLTAVRRTYSAYVFLEKK